MVKAAAQDTGPCVPLLVRFYTFFSARSVLRDLSSTRPDVHCVSWELLRRQKKGVIDPHGLSGGCIQGSEGIDTVLRIF